MILCDETLSSWYMELLFPRGNAIQRYAVMLRCCMPVMEKGLQQKLLVAEVPEHLGKGHCRRPKAQRDRTQV